MFQFPAWLSLSGYMRFAFGDLGVKSCMHLTQAYRSLPRPSSKFKPSYPSNSFIESIFLHFDLIKSFTSAIKAEMSLVISYTVLIEYNPVARVFSNSPNQRSWIRFIVNFFKSWFAFSSQKRVECEMDPPRIERGYPRCKRGILPLDYGPVISARMSFSHQTQNDEADDQF